MRCIMSEWSDSILNDTLEAKKWVISVPVKDFIHSHHRALFYDIPGWRRSFQTYPCGVPVL